MIKFDKTIKFSYNNNIKRNSPSDPLMFCKMSGDFFQVDFSFSEDGYDK